MATRASTSAGHFVFCLDSHQASGVPKISNRIVVRVARAMVRPMASSSALLKGKVGSPRWKSLRARYHF